MNFTITLNTFLWYYRVADFHDLDCDDITKSALTSLHAYLALLLDVHEGFHQNYKGGGTATSCFLSRHPPEYKAHFRTSYFKLSEFTWVVVCFIRFQSMVYLIGLSHTETFCLIYLISPQQKTRSPHIPYTYSRKPEPSLKETVVVCSPAALLKIVMHGAGLSLNLSGTACIV